jgi:hypothetical protein
MKLHVGRYASECVLALRRHAELAIAAVEVPVVSCTGLLCERMQQQ